MKRETVLAVLQLVSSMRESVEEAGHIVDEEALQVGDRNIIDHSLNTIGDEIEVLSRTFSDMLADPSRIES